MNPISKSHLHVPMAPKGASDRLSFVNYQHWHIECGLDPEQDCIQFYLRDDLGDTHIATQCLVSKVNPALVQDLNMSKTPQEKSSRLHVYLQQRLQDATPYQVHVETRNGRPFVYLGDYGLKGGGKKTKRAAMAVSGVCVVAGVALCSSGIGAPLGAPLLASSMAGSALLGAGIGSGVEAYKQNPDTFTIEEHGKKCAKAGARSGLSGAVTGAAGPWLKGLAFVPKLLGLATAGGVANAVSSTVVEGVENGRLPSSEQMATELISGAAGGAVGCGGGEGAGLLMGLAGQGISAAAGGITDGLLLGAAQVGKRAVEGGVGGIAGGCAGQVATNWREKKPLTNKIDRGFLLENGLVGAGSGALLAAGELFKKRSVANRLGHEQEKAAASRARVDEAEREAQRTQGEAEAAQENYQQAEETLRVREEARRNLQADLDQRNLDAQEAQRQLEQAGREVVQAEKATAEARAQRDAAQAIARTAKTGAAVLENKIRAYLEARFAEGYRPELVDPEGRLRVRKSPRTFSRILPELVERASRGERLVLRRGDARISYRASGSIQERYQAAQRLAQDAGAQAADLDFALEQETSRLHREQTQSKEQQAAAARARQEVHAGEAFLRAQAEQVASSRAEVAAAQERAQAEAVREANLRDAAARQMAVEGEAAREYQLQEASRRGTNPALQAALAERVKGTWLDFGDCSLADLIPHVVLVHAINGLPPEVPGSPVDVLQEKIKHNGTVGHYIHFQESQFRDIIIDRPQVHWAWNQLVQCHGPRDNISSWEDAIFAVLDPLSAFEDSDHQPWGVAPYDTMSVGPHRPSEQSTILVPHSILAETQAWITREQGFLGRIRPYPDGQTIRQAIMEVLDAHYPEIWHVCDERGERIGHKIVNTSAGFGTQTCLRRSDGRTTVLIRGEGLEPRNRISQSMKEYGEKRFIGLHSNSCTVLLERDPKDAFNEYFQALKEFMSKRTQSQKKNRQPMPTAAKQPFFIANTGYETHFKALGGLGILKVFNLYQKFVTKYDERTGTHNLANYLLNEAMCADLMSIFYKRDATGQQQFSFHGDDLMEVFQSNRDSLIALLTNIATCQLPEVDRKIFHFDSSKEGAVRDFFAQYHRVLETILGDLEWRARRRTIVGDMREEKKE